MKNIFRIVVPVLALLLAAAGSAMASVRPDGREVSVQASADTCTVVLVDFGPNKVKVIKIVKEYLGVGLKEAHDLVNAAPSVIKEGISRKEADELAESLMAAEAKVEIKATEKE